MINPGFIERLKSGDRPAYTELLEQYGSRVFNTALGILQNREDAEDTTQNVFTEVFESVKGFNEESTLATWIYRITVSKSLEMLRRKKAKKRFGFITGFLGLEERINRSYDSVFYHPGVQLENKERAAILFKAVARLSENQKTAFVLHNLEGLSYAEIAAIMKVSVSAVESLMVRAKRNLQSLLSDYYDKNER